MQLDNRKSKTGRQKFPPDEAAMTAVAVFSGSQCGAVDTFFGSQSGAVDSFSGPQSGAVDTFSGPQCGAVDVFWGVHSTRKFSISAYLKLKSS